MTPIRLGIAIRRKGACGIRDYAERLAAALPEAETVWIDTGACHSARDWRRAAQGAAGLDVVHAHYEYQLFGRVSPFRNLFAAFLRGLPAPCVVTLHDALPRLWRGARSALRGGAANVLRQAFYAPFLAARWERRQYRRAAGAVAHNAGIARRARQVLGYHRVLLTPHPVPRCAVQWAPGRRPPAESRLVTPGFIKEHKGYDEALPMFSAQPGWTWVLAGGPQDGKDREYLDRLEAKIAERGLASRVRITGYLPAEEMERVTAECDAALFPFRRVTGSGTLALAQGLGMPILATGRPALKDLREEGAGLVLLDPSDPRRWLQAAASLLGDPAALRSCAARNREFARANGYDRLARRMEAIFREILSRPPASGGHP